MKRRASFRIVAVAVLSSLALSCAPTRIAPISASGAAFAPDRDESRLWEQAREEEVRLRGKASLYQDPLLEDYLEGVVSRLNPPGMAANRRLTYTVTVVEDPTLNAFAYPHGALYVHTGLLARMENEDQLATVLGHEMSHVENRHMLRYQRSARNRHIAAVAGAVAASIVLEKQVYDAERAGRYGSAAATRVLSQVILGLGLQLAVLAAVNGYGRELEREADDGGFRKIAAAGYDAREAPKVYQGLMDDHGEPGKAEAFFFGNHPRLGERIEAANAWNGAHPA
jgi:predicted Zn-dependent protease